MKRLFGQLQRFCEIFSGCGHTDESNEVNDKVEQI